MLFSCIHFFPMALLLLDFRHNRYRFAPRRLILYFGYGILYMGLNISKSHLILVYTVLHRPVYPILKWNDLASYINVAICLALAAGAFGIARSVKGRRGKKGQQGGYQQGMEERDGDGDGKSE